MASMNAFVIMPDHNNTILNKSRSHRKKYCSVLNINYFKGFLCFLRELTFGQLRSITWLNLLQRRNVLCSVFANLFSHL